MVPPRTGGKGMKLQHSALIFQIITTVACSEISSTTGENGKLVGFAPHHRPCSKMGGHKGRRNIFSHGWRRPAARPPPIASGCSA